MIFQISDVSICKGNMNEPIETSTFYTKYYFKHFFFVSVVMANIGSAKYFW